MFEIIHTTEDMPSIIIK